jgi:hypothetical protein
MRRADDVFFFTLIDFLIQVFFFGLLMFVIGQAESYRQDEERLKNKHIVERLLSETGFSNLTELTDFLSRLAPPEEFKGIADFFSAQKKDEIKQAMELVQRAGGVEEVRGKLKSYDEKFGKKSCIAKKSDGTIPISAVFTLNDDSITLEQEKEDFSKLLLGLKKESSQVKVLSTEQFRQVYGNLKNLYPDCLYHVTVRVNTKYLEPMEAVRSAFRTFR